MPNCKKCGHPHGWYQGLCRPCAVEAGIALVPAPEEARVEIGSVAPEPGTTTETIEPEVESVPEVEKPKPSRRTSTRRAKK